MTWNLRYDAAVPPLPPDIVVRNHWKELHDNMRHGCWLIRVLPKYDDDVGADYHYLFYYEGTLRVEWTRSPGEKPQEYEEDSKNLRISGDLYRRRVKGFAEAQQALPVFGAGVSQQIPIFERSEYRYYLRGTDVTLLEDKIELTLEVHRLDPKDLAWLAEGKLKAALDLPTADLPKAKPPKAKPPKADLSKAKSSKPQGDFRSTLTNELGTEVGSIEVRHVSQWLRRAVVEVDMVYGTKNPLRHQDPQHPEHGFDHPTVEDVFHEVGWDVQVSLPDPNDPESDRPLKVPEPGGAVWSPGMLHEHMLRWRDRPSTDLDKEWRYHLLCVRRLTDRNYFGFGLMYDSAAFDSNHIPREGAAIAHNARFPLEKDIYGKAAFGEILGEVPEAYFRTAIHELGHAMGLAHTLGQGNSFMEGTRAIALRSKGSFPENIDYSFHPADACRLRHLPDIWVRPGGLPFRWRFAFEAVPVDDLTDEDDDFKLTAVPLNSSLPLGAPLRISVSLRNQNRNEKRLVPTDLSLKSGHISGRLIDPLGGIRTFATALRFVGNDWKYLEPGDSVRHAVTLLRGREGALMPIPGRYSLEIEVAWEVPHHETEKDGKVQEVKGGRVLARDTSHFLVSPEEDRGHAHTAYRVLGDTHLMLPLVFRSHSCEDFSEATRRDLRYTYETLQECLRDQVLRPHYAVIEAKRLGEKESRAVDAAQWIDESTVMSGTEIVKIAEMLKDAKTDDATLPVFRRAAKVCRDKAEELGVHGRVTELLPRDIFND